MTPRPPHLFVASLTLAALHGCAPTDEPLRPRGLEIEPMDPVDIDVEPLQPEPLPPQPLAPAPASCLVGAKLVLSHDDGTVEVSEDPVEGLTGVRPLDRIDLRFTLAPECAEAYGDRVSLVAATRPTFAPMNLATTPSPRAYDMASARVGDGEGHLVVQVPGCAFRIDLALGEPLQRPGDGHEYADRAIAAAFGGAASCDEVPRLEVAFDPVEAGWGDAPVEAHFGWSIVDDTPGAPTCELDLDDDGVFEAHLDPCALDTQGVKLAGLPHAVFAAVGEHRPVMVVHHAGRRIWAATSIFANHLELKEGVQNLEAAEGFVDAAVSGDPPGPITVVLSFAGDVDPPKVKVDDLVIGHAGAGYMIRVQTVEHEGGVLTLTGEHLGLEEVVESGFFGIRDLAIETASARCLEGCVGEITPIAAGPVGQKNHDGPQVAKLDGGGEEVKKGISVTAKIAEGAAELEFFAGFVLERFVLDVGWGIKSVEFRGGPTLEAELALKMAIAKATVGLGKWRFGGLPTPVPIIVVLEPRLTLEATIQAVLTGSATVGFTIIKDSLGWFTDVAPNFDAGFGGLKVESGVEAEAKEALEIKIGLLFGGVSGPYIAPTIGLGMAESTDFCDVCLNAILEAGVLLGWDFLGGDLFEPFKVSEERELGKVCWELVEGCGPPPEGPPDGGSSGDVHIVSFDGLLFDFQAGGEFVLTRSLDDAIEIQTRQEPNGEATSIAYNTAVATRVGGGRVGIYARLPDRVVVDGAPVVMAIGESVPVGVGGSLLRSAFDEYSVRYPTDEEMIVQFGANESDERRHLNLTVRLSPERVGAVEGLLGDANGDTSDDLRIGGGAFLGFPVSFEALHSHEPDGFIETWRVDPADSLFDYAPGTGPGDFRGAPYDTMPTWRPSYGPHTDLAAEACGECPAILWEACMLDVSHTGDASLASVCETMPPPATILPPSERPLIVTPDHGQSFPSCDDQVLVFKAEGAGDADQFPDGHDFEIVVEGWVQVPSIHDPGAWETLQTFRTTESPGGADWGDTFTCEPIGDGTWGQCALRIHPRGPTCGPDPFTYGYRWRVRSLEPGKPYAEGRFLAP
ncbi:MAG: VWD domain-containing protein [Nannocystaceae bacterium]